jgi:hypothetical protein
MSTASPKPAPQNPTMPSATPQPVPETAADQPPSAGRPRLLTPEKQQQFINLLHCGCSRAEAARAVGVSLRGAYRLYRDDPDFAAAVNLALCNSDAQAYRAITSAGPKNWRAAAWLIEHRTRREERPRAASPESLLKSQSFQDLLRDVVCQAIVANETALDPGVVQRKKRLAELREKIEDYRRRGENAVFLETTAHDLTREIAKILKLTLRPR